MVTYVDKYYISVSGAGRAECGCVRRRRRARAAGRVRAELCYLGSGPALAARRAQPAADNMAAARPAPEPRAPAEPRSYVPHAGLPPLAFMVLMKTTLINSQQSHAPCTPQLLCLLFPYHFKAPHFDFSRVSPPLCFVC